MRNIELKSKLKVSIEEGASRFTSAGAERIGNLVQTDTYFHAPAGRLKLREIEDAKSELIAYSRADDAATRASDYHLVAIPDPDALKTALGATLGIRGVVHKRRQLLMWKNVRIHLDDVAGLGAFIEFEAVLTGEHREDAAYENLQYLAGVVGLLEEDRIAGSYIDLVLGSGR